MNKRTVIIAAVAVIGVCLCCAVVAVGFTVMGGLGIFGLTQPVADVGDKFMQSLKDGNYTAAHALMAPDLQRKIGTPQDLRRMVESGKAQPSKWTFTTRNIENDEGHLEGSVTMQGGEGTVTVDLVKLGNDWRVIAFNLQED
jgi:hypothetical protein